MKHDQIDARYILSLNLNEQLIIMEHKMHKVKESWPVLCQLSKVNVNLTRQWSHGNNHFSIQHLLITMACIWIWTQFEFHYSSCFCLFYLCNISMPHFFKNLNFFINLGKSCYIIQSWLGNNDFACWTEIKNFEIFQWIAFLSQKLHLVKFAIDILSGKVKFLKVCI